MAEPVDPLTALGTAAATMHETFRSYRAAGFTEDQALHLVIAIMQMAFEAAQAEINQE